MKILLLHQYYLEDNDPGGSRFNEMTQVWQNNGHEIQVIAGMIHANGLEKPQSYKGKFFVRNTQKGGIKVLRCHVSESYNSSFIGRLWGYFSFMFSSLYGGIFKLKFKPDVIIVTSPPLFIGITGYVLSKFRRVPYIFEVRDLWPESAIDTGVLQNKFLIKLSFAVEGFLYRHATRINVLTPAFQEKLISDKRIAPSKIAMIPNAADFRLSDELLKTFDPQQFRKDLGIDDKFVVTYVGAHGVANHLVQLLDSAEKIDNEKVLFQLIGDGMQKNWLKEEANRRSLSNVIFIDSIPKKEVFKYIIASDLGASVLKRVETFKTIYSNKTFDYMACMKPVLLCIDGVSRRLVEDANCGVYAEPENPEAIAKAIKFYLNNPELIKIHGESGYAYAKKNFDRSVLAKKYLDVISSSKSISK